MAKLENKLEAVLFYKAEPESKARLATLLGVTLEEVEQAARMLATSLADRGIRLLSIDDQLELVTAPETSDSIAQVRKEELVRDLGKAGAETLAIVLYRGPCTRAEIEFIRGVNSSFMLRNLQIRGLVERVPHPERVRSYVYRATPATLEHLGITDVAALPDYADVRRDVESFESQARGHDGSVDAEDTMTDAPAQQGGDQNGGQQLSQQV